MNKELRERVIKEEFENLLWKIVFKHLTQETQEFIKLRFSSILDQAYKAGQDSKLADDIIELNGYKKGFEAGRRIFY